MLRSIEMPDLFEAPASSAVARRLMEEARGRIDDYIYDRNSPALSGFVPSDFAIVDAGLRWIVQQQLATGPKFCEWGSGFGVIAMLAALHQFDACGIEADAALVDEARQLAEDFDIAVDFAHGSLIPEEQDHLTDLITDYARIETDSPSGYSQLDLELDDFDLIYVYPWPGEELFCEQLFDRCAADGALLLTYHGIDQLRLRRRVRK
jgi:hypothetical protein